MILKQLKKVYLFAAEWPDPLDVDVLAFRLICSGTVAGVIFGCFFFRPAADGGGAGGDGVDTITSVSYSHSESDLKTTKKTSIETKKKAKSFRIR